MDYYPPIKPEMIGYSTIHLTPTEGGVLWLTEDGYALKDSDFLKFVSPEVLQAIKMIDAPFCALLPPKNKSIVEYLNFHLELAILGLRSVQLLNEAPLNNRYIFEYNG